jgi:hypothetical protein
VKKPTAARDLALVMGVARYVDSDTYPQLEGPPADCTKFRDWLINAASVPANQVEMVTWNPTGPQPFPTFADLNQALERLLFPARNRAPRSGRRLYLFSAGHCEAQGALDADVITADTARLIPASFPLTKIANRIRSSGLFREIVVFIDGCRTFTGTEVQPFTFNLALGSPEDVANVRYLVAFATQYNKLAYEDQFGNEVRGIFSYALMEGLSGAARDDNGNVTNQSLALYLRERVPQLRAANTDQVPEVYCPMGLQLA